jgi:hypothetical protein
MNTNTQTFEISNNHLTSAQLRTFRKFRRRLSEKVPDYHIAWVRPFKENIIEVGLEPDKMTYRKNQRAAKAAIEVEDETGITIILL